ncbi:MAG: CHASE domain-containing protein [Candidatus Thiodiazotropha sp.]
MNPQHPSTPIPLPPDGGNPDLQTRSSRLMSALWDYLPVALVALMSMGITLGMFMQSLNWERRQADIAFREAAQIRILLIQRDITFTLGLVKDLASLFEASEVVGRREFRKFVGPALKNRTGVKSLAWVPHVTQRQLGGFIDNARLSFPKFTIQEPDDSRAEQHTEHYPVLYVQPYAENKSRLGLDLIADANIMALFQEALSSRQQQAATKPRGHGTLSSEITVAMPVFYNEEDEPGIDTASEFRGFALGFFDLGTIVEHALATLSPGSVHLHFFLRDRRDPESHLYTHVSRVQTEHQHANLAYQPSDPEYTETIRIDNEEWDVVCQPASDRFEAEFRNSWIILSGGIAFSLLLTIYAAGLVERARQVRLEVAERTAQLREIVTELNLEVSERKAAETELQLLNETLEQHIASRTAEAERRAEYLEQFAYVTSHDLKAPLRAVSNLAEWIEEDLQDKITPVSKEQLALLRDRVRRMHELIEGLLEYSRVGKTEDTETWVDTRVLIEEIIDSLSPSKDFIITIDEEMPVLMADRLQLGQVFSNLISNALKYHGGKNGHIRIDGKAFDDTYRFRVCDDGQGIAPEYHDKVFMMFQTLESRDFGNSTGIGLALVKKIVVEHGGEIQLESELGKGACFSFTWPVKHPQQETLA